MPIITFASSKGGAGKTTSAIVLATTLGRHRKVVLIDADPAGSLLSWAEKAKLPGRLTVRTTQGETFIRGELLEAAKEAEFVIVDLDRGATRLNAYALGESDLVIIPMGDEHQDAEAAIETLGQVNLEAKVVRREIPTRILFARTRVGGKSRLSSSLSAQVRDRVGAFERELHSQRAIASLHNLGGTLYDMRPDEVSGVPRAIAHAELFADEVEQILKSIQDTQRKAQNAQRRRAANPTVQMSVRMPEETYERFRALCQRERRTNGDQIRVLMSVYEQTMNKA